MNKSAHTMFKKGFTLIELLYERHNWRRQTIKGFTLIELLIVIAIIGILAAAILVAINPTKRTNQAKDANVKNDVQSIAGALQGYFTTNATYPLDTATMQTNGDLKTIPVDPSGNAYTYRKYPSANTCVVGSLCTDAAIYGPVYDQASGGTVVWCWESVTGQTKQISVAANCDNSAATN